MRWVLLLSLMFWGSLAWAQTDEATVAPADSTEAVSGSQETAAPQEAADTSEEIEPGKLGSDESPDTAETEPEATDLTELLRPSLGPNVLESLLDDSRFIDGLIPPLDPLAERARVASSTGRSDPFQPLNIRPVQPPDPPTVPDLPTLPNLDDTPTISLPPSPPQPTPDPAEFAKTVQVAGVIQIGDDTFAVLSSESALSEVVGVGSRYETAFVSSISIAEGQVLLEEGGQTISLVIPE